MMRAEWATLHPMQRARLTSPSATPVLQGQAAPASADTAQARLDSYRHNALSCSVSLRHLPFMSSVKYKVCKVCMCGSIGTEERSGRGVRATPVLLPPAWSMPSRCAAASSCCCLAASACQICCPCRHSLLSIGSMHAAPSRSRSAAAMPEPRCQQQLGLGPAADQDAQHAARPEGGSCEPWGGPALHAPASPRPTQHFGDLALRVAHRRLAVNCQLDAAPLGGGFFHCGNPVPADPAASARGVNRVWQG